MASGRMGDIMREFLEIGEVRSFFDNLIFYSDTSTKHIVTYVRTPYYIVNISNVNNICSFNVFVH